jgi:hypothetical protein
MPRLLALVVAVLTLVYLHDVAQRLRPPPTLGEPVPGPQVARIPIERVGQGVSCLPVERAARLAIPRFARRCPRADGGEVPCGRMGAARRLLLGDRIDPVQASYDELLAVPGIGPALAARIVAARPADAAGLARIRGLGRARAGALVGPLGLDDPARHDICSMGSWPTTSSGSDRPP